MAREHKKLTALAISRAKQRGYYADGGGLYLQVSASGAKSWVFRFKKDGRLREMGLGPTHTITLAEAREHAVDCRKLRLRDVDPIEARQSDKAETKLALAKSMTFRQCAEAYIAAHKSSWVNAKHAAQWPSTLSTYAYPVFGNLPVQSVDVALVTKALEPIWQTKTETASRLRGRIETVLDWATARNFRQGDNPARWRGHLDKLLPQRSKVQKVEHHSALPYVEIGAFMGALRAQTTTSALALEFLILTAARTGEVIGAKWGEFDLSAALWTIPAERMKARREHRVPLSRPALSILKRLFEHRSGEFVFPGGRAAKPLSNMALLMLLERMNRSDLTVHGFRSTFRDWAAERTNFPREVAEHALAHSLPDKIEAAYRRGDLFDKRRKMMDAWADFVFRPPPAGQVVPLGSKPSVKLSDGRTL
jgi:integrase